MMNMKKETKKRVYLKYVKREMKTKTSHIQLFKVMNRKVHSNHLWMLNAQSRIIATSNTIRLSTIPKTEYAFCITKKRKNETCEEIRRKIRRSNKCWNDFSLPRVNMFVHVFKLLKINECWQTVQCFVLCHTMVQEKKNAVLIGWLVRKRSGFKIICTFSLNYWYNELMCSNIQFKTKRKRKYEEKKNNKIVFEICVQ